MTPLERALWAIVLACAAIVARWLRDEIALAGISRRADETRVEHPTNRASAGRVSIFVQDPVTGKPTAWTRVSLEAMERERRRYRA